MSHKPFLILIMSLIIAFIGMQTLYLTGFADLQSEAELKIDPTERESLEEESLEVEVMEEIEQQQEAEVILNNYPSNEEPYEKPYEKPYEEQIVEAEVSPPAKVARVDKRLNSETKNTNILCLGIAEKKLEMIAVYSINKDNKKSAGIFFPTRISLSINAELKTLSEIYNQYGILALKKALSQSLLIDIPYHMAVDKGGLIELSELMGPLYVENEEIDLPNLFVRPVGAKDELILQSLADEVTKPKMIMQIPRLITIFLRNVESDIGLGGLRELYHVFSKLDHSELGKVVLWGERTIRNGREFLLIDPFDWHNIIYEMTLKKQK